MARALPDALERRNYLYSDGKRPVDHVGLAERYLEAGRKSDALDFIDRIADPARKDALRAKVRDEALRDGNYFLLNRIDAASPIGEERWRDALKRARETGKLRFALKIARKLGDAAATTELEDQLGIIRPVVTPTDAAGGPPTAIPPQLAGDDVRVPPATPAEAAPLSDAPPQAGDGEAPSS